MSSGPNYTVSQRGYIILQTITLLYTLEVEYIPNFIKHLISPSLPPTPSVKSSLSSASSGAGTAASYISGAVDETIAAPVAAPVTEFTVGETGTLVALQTGGEKRSFLR